jgi:hypothetical protein
MAPRKGLDTHQNNNNNNNNNIYLLQMGCHPVAVIAIGTRDLNIEISLESARSKTLDQLYRRTELQ